ncbi:hypothetical protein CHS0354_040559 [Potamilus streckersoni]|uniref:Uncharacterized protein n=1 Tax=Potamilus streckersoni TaxID=2493646 RepID=A0AAE0SH80_9BIVA|nr:hypothetical protein CHS0354_040559 [Potamilus streckersoni]
MLQVSQPVTQSFGMQMSMKQMTFSTERSFPMSNISPEKVDRSHTRIPKVNQFGIEVISGIVWQGWEPGREYTKNIILKNVKVRTQKIKYMVPSTRFFTTLYPKPVVLSAGTSFSLPITFRPLEKVRYEDKIEFHTKEGSFVVPIKATLPEYHIQVPERIDFNMCAAHDYSEATFTVTNTGDLVTDIHWEVLQPFSVDPVSVSLKEGESYTFRAIFKPTAATVYEADALCKYGTDGSLSETTVLYGIGKYPHILVSTPGQPSTALTKDNLEAVITFGQTQVGASVQKMVELHNLSMVRVPFRVEHPTGISRIDTVFSSSKVQGVVQPMSSLKLPLTYTPNTVDTTSIDYFNIIPIGTVSKSVVKCIGSSKGPTVQLSAKVINFMQIDVGEVATRPVDLVNNSDADAVYQFMIDCDESVFKFERTSGLLKPNSKQTVILKFVPQHPINYHRKVTCMIHNQGPLFLDLIGTCHSELIKPAVLLSKHLERFRVHVERGFSVFPPEQLNELRKQGRLELDDSGALMAPVLDPEAKEPESLPELSPMDAYFNDGFHSEVINFVPHVSLDISVIDFGNCQNLRVIENKLFNLTNHTKGKITVQWITDEDRPFYVMPATADIPPLKSCTFHVTFRPKAPNQFYGAELESFVYYKSLRDYKLVEDTTHCPPWCLTLTCLGHTFMPNNETFLPRFTLDFTPLVFPAVNTKESAYRTLLLSNTGTTPIQFDIQRDPANTFFVKPAKALLKDSHQIFVVKATPAEVKTYKQKITLKLNDNVKYNQELEMWGSAEAPNVLLETQGEMYFKQTCVGTSSQRTYTIKNISRIPLMFEWKLKYADNKLLRVEPNSGIVQPNESLSQTWYFTPKAEQKYVMKPCLITWGKGFSNNSSGGKKRQFDVRAVGEGTIGEIKADQSYLDFGDVVVGSSSSKHITFMNNSTCSLHYKLSIDQTIDGPYADEITRTDSLAVELEQMEGIIPARSRHTIIATVRPIRRVTYQFAISYQLVIPEGNESSGSVHEPQHLCHLLVAGVFPMMSVTDARCYGSAIGISKKQLWSLFSLDNLNVCLDSDPSARELMYSVATRHSHQRRPPVYTRAIMDFNFSAAPLGSEPCIVNLMFENTGTVAVEWAFLFPSDLQLELEYWAETGEFTEDELHEMKVMDNKLFTIEPRKGCMDPGECQTVTFSYRHTMAGTDRLPVLLKLSRGREILLNFLGVTVEQERHYIHFPANKHMFTPVPVGEKISPKQVYEMYNGGALPLRYEIDLTPLELIKQENFDQAIFECLNPRGEIPPGRSMAVEWRFSPIEAKTYMVDVPIRVHNGDTAIVTFTGVGYDKRLMGDTMLMTDQHDLTGVPGVQSVPVPGQLAYLSQERISFNNMPLFSRGRRMVFIINRSKERVVSFAWHVTTPSNSQYLSISPVRGCLEPGESKMCRVTFNACGVPSFYDLDLVCEVTDEVEYGKFKEKLAEWEHERERQKYEFTITEKDLDADKRIENVEIMERTLSKISPREESSRPVAGGDLSKYKTLPPIKKPSADEERLIQKKKKKKEEELWEKPEPPLPFLLHLGLTARTHDIREFQINFEDEYKNFYVDRLLSEKLSTKISKKKEQLEFQSKTIQCSQAESEVISGVMSNVLRGLLDDSQFVESIKKVSKDPIPYFLQIGERPTTPVAGKGSSAKAGADKSSTRSQGGVSSPRSSASSIRRMVPSDRSSTGSAKSQTREQPSFDLSIEKSEEQPRHSKSAVRKVKFQEQKLRQQQELKKKPEFGNVAESLIENTLLNIMSEALEGEFNIAARPRYIALPKRNNSAQNRGSKS